MASSEVKGYKNMKQIAAACGPEAKEVIIAWVREQGYVSGQVRIRQHGESVWVELVDGTAARD